MNINALPVIGWFLSFVCNVSLAVPFWICWTACGIGKLYFDFLPERWQSIPFWNCVGIFISVSIITSVLVPKIASVSQSSNTKKD